MLSFSRCTEKLAMKTTKTFSNAILYVLVACSLWITASACPETHTNNSSEADNVMRRRYDSWLKRHGRKHRNKEEWDVRFAIYQANVKFIELVNSQNHSYKLTDNKFADLTNDEFRSRHLGYRRQLPLQTGFRYQEHEDLYTELPKSIDWRKKGAVTHIKDQGNCGSCWAFSAVAAVEGIHKIKTGKLATLSEQELIDCDISNGNEGCDGGDMETAFVFIRKQGGLATEKDYPYQGSDDTCNRVKARKHAVSISGYENVPARKQKLLKVAVARQPVAVAIDAGGHAFQLYSRGIFSGSCGKDLNHGVTIVGYGEEKGDKFWLVKNSWATDWGESGYIRMKRDTRDKDGACGIAMDASYPVKH